MTAPMTREEVSAEDRQIMGSPEAAKLALIERTKEWRALRQPVMANRAALNEIDAKEREARFQLANAAALWLWHEENPTPGVAQQPWQPIDAAVPVDEWPKEIDERVLIYVVHEHAQYEPDPAIRLAEWEGWCVGYWTDFDFGKGGWVWHGMLGTVTHVAALLPPPSNQGASK